MDRTKHAFYSRFQSNEFYRLYDFQTDLKRGIISINLGQCGAQIGQSLWELFCLEHDVLNSGKIRKRNRNNLDLSTNGTLFEECSNGKYVPRAVFFDTEPSVIGTFSLSCAKITSCWYAKL